VQDVGGAVHRGAGGIGMSSSDKNSVIVAGRKMSADDFESSKNLHVGGSLHIKNIDIIALPEGLHVVGSIYLENIGILTFPERLHVEGSLYLDDIHIFSLPESLRKQAPIVSHETNAELSSKSVSQFWRK
jgi:hypothetical protein